MPRAPILARTIVGSLSIVTAGCTPLANTAATNAASAPQLLANATAPVHTDETPAPPASPPQEQIALEDDQGVFRVPVLINGAVRLSFMIDSGASDVVIPADVAMTLARTGTITRADFIGNETFELADGSTMPSPEFRIRSLRVGNLELQNVTASITNVNGNLLLGQTFLSRLTSWSIDNQRHMLIMIGPQATTQVAAPVGLAPTVAAAPSAPMTVPSSAPQADVSELAEAAEARAQAFYAAWSGSDAESAENVRSFFGDTVQFYGAMISVYELMAKERQFAARWPVRQYVPRPGSLSASCSDAQTCIVQGLVDWRASSPLEGRYSTGVAQFSFVFSGGLIVAESGKVISRG